MFPTHHSLPAEGQSHGSVRAPAQLRGYWGIGVLPQMLRDPLRFGSRAVSDHDGIVRLKLGPSEVYLIGDQDYAHHILRERAANYNKSGGMWDALRLLAGDGLGTSDGETWLRQRRMMQPLFHRQRLRGLLDLMTSAVGECMSDWDAAAGAKGAFDIGPALANITLRVVLKSIFSISIADHEIAAFQEAVRVVFSYIGHRMWTYFLPEWLPLPGRGRFQAALRLIDRVILRIIDERRRHAVQGAEDLLAMLLSARDETAGEGMTDRQLRDEAVGFLIGGFETTADALTWTMYLLGRHQDAQRTLHEEIGRELAGSAPTIDGLAQLAYTKMVFQESLRLYPPAWIIPRRAVHDDQIGNYSIPRGATVAMLYYAIHRHPAYWDEPEMFKPERFADGIAARSRAYLPFGAGARQCIGSHFAMMEGMLVLALLMQRFHIKLWPGHSVEPQGTLSLRPRHGVRVSLERHTTTA